MSAAPVVATATGDVRGASVAAPSGRGVQRFLGIPYAAPPVADLRWRAPVPPRPWAGVRSAEAFAPAAPQAGALESALPGFSPDGPMSEDCLALNVWTPGLDGRRPVLVWIPGGAYLSGATSQPVYDAARLADEGDLVVVTVAYRLGALGFLAVDGDGVANCGLRDQLAALAWVRQHAGAFGGDPRRVTVMGESAGAGSVLHLLASPMGGGAFERAIVQSAQPTTLESEVAGEVAVRFAEALALVSPDTAALRGLSIERLLDAQRETSAAMLRTVGPMAFAPSIDGQVCDRHIPDAVASGRGREIDLVIGTTQDELALFPDPGSTDLDEARLFRRIEVLGPHDAPRRVLERYRRVLGDASMDRIWDAIRTDAVMVVPNDRVALAHATQGGRTYVYRFGWEAPNLGAAHAVDLPFTFGTFDREGWGTAVGWDERAEDLGRVWRACWAAFAATGDPSPPGITWPAHGSTTRLIMTFAPDGATVGSSRHLRAAAWSHDG